MERPDWMTDPRVLAATRSTAEWQRRRAGTPAWVLGTERGDWRVDRYSVAWDDGYEGLVRLEHHEDDIAQIIEAIDEFLRRWVHQEVTDAD